MAATGRLGQFGEDHALIVLLLLELAMLALFGRRTSNPRGEV